MRTNGVKQMSEPKPTDYYQGRASAISSRCLPCRGIWRTSSHIVRWWAKDDMTGTYKARTISTRSSVTVRRTRHVQGVHGRGHQGDD